MNQPTVLDAELDCRGAVEKDFVGFRPYSIGMGYKLWSFVTFAILSP